MARYYQSTEVPTHPYRIRQPPGPHGKDPTALPRCIRKAVAPRTDLPPFALASQRINQCPADQGKYAPVYESQSPESRLRGWVVRECLMYVVTLLARPETGQVGGLVVELSISFPS